MNDKMIAIIERPKSCLYCTCFKVCDTKHGEYVTHGKCGITNEIYYCNGSYVVEKNPMDNCPLKEIHDRME